MAKADEQDSGVGGPGTDPNPGTISSPAEPVVSLTRPRRPAAVAGMEGSTSDTMLSLPPPAGRDELLIDERLSNLERRTEELLVRLERLEQAPGAVAVSSRASWLWLVFLVGLAVAWQALQYVR
ncbi:MAG TPA: hypothetical protein VER33_24580 [Polyangiaceae bacterium]|nr:hypothetical protein [Polyangiaceae bacterium]